MARVQLENVSKIYPGNVKAVDRVSLDIADREFVVLVGPSGCGKTTTLRMVAGLEEISAGTIRIGDRVVNDVAPKDRDIAMVFQNYALYPHMTVYNNMAFGLKLRRVPRQQIDQRVREVARTLDIAHLLDRKPKALSGGQRQRVAVGRAIVREPKAFLFDEPLSNLDAKLRVTTRAELKRLHQRLQTTTIYVTHDQEEAMTLGERIVVMKDGIIQQADAPLRTYNHPVNRFVAGFIGMPPMNFFDGVLRPENGTLTFFEAKGSAGAPVADELTLSDEGFRLRVPCDVAERIAHRVGSAVVLGIRPEHFAFRPDQPPSDRWTPIPFGVNVVEPLGNDMDVYMNSRLHQNVVARLEAQEGIDVDSRITLHADLRKIHFFEPGDAGMNLCQPTESAHAVA